MEAMEGFDTEKVTECFLFKCFIRYWTLFPTVTVGYFFAKAGEAAEEETAEAKIPIINEIIRNAIKRFKIIRLCFIIITMPFSWFVDFEPQI